MVLTGFILILLKKVFRASTGMTGFTLFNKEVLVETDSNNPSALCRLSAKKVRDTAIFQQCIFFEFVSLNYTSDERKHYFYKLEGFDKSWIEAGTTRTATYTHLPAGTYTFKVKG